VTRPTPEERLADPAGHFPYKHNAALSAAARTVSGLVASAGLSGTSVGDALQADLMEYAVAEVDATADYVAAQEAWLRAQTPEARADERAAAVALANARQAYRVARPRLIQDALTADADSQEG
jgi:hypothetical protein